MCLYGRSEPYWMASVALDIQSSHFPSRVTCLDNARGLKMRSNVNGNKVRSIDKKHASMFCAKADTNRHKSSTIPCMISKRLDSTHLQRRQGQRRGRHRRSTSTRGLERRPGRGDGLLRSVGSTGQQRRRRQWRILPAAASAVNNCHGQDGCDQQHSHLQSQESCRNQS